MEDLTRSIAALQAQVKELVLQRAQSHVINEKLDHLDYLEQEYTKARARENMRLGDSLKLAEIGIDTPSFLVTGRPGDASVAVARWNNVLTVWAVGQKWKAKAKQTKLLGDATALLKKLEQKEHVQEEISDLRASLYALRQRKNLSEAEMFVKKRLEEQLRRAESDMKALLTRDTVEIESVRYSPEELRQMHKLESGCMLMMLAKQGKSKPLDQLFTLDPYTGSVLWGDDRNASVINSAVVTGVEWGPQAYLHTKFVSDAQLRYSIKLLVLQGGKEQVLHLVAYNQDEFDLWSKGVFTVVERLADSRARSRSSMYLPQVLSPSPSPSS
eukprot:ANDGO_01118.mRNA.1 hypothetical protein